ncbi:hypothetical protein B9S53_10305 [Arthrospira sp. O9.13F]|nr:hypothetical protein B9S53_20995 [Arthrospira sp. O9.13F]RAQ43857.1 hypothetical protein B9S53_10305 [Arthrospira sp. O9.13F]
MMVIAELARDIYIQLMSRDIPYSNQDTRIKLAEVAHNAAIDLMTVHQQWISSHDAIIQPAPFIPNFNSNGYSSDIFMGGEFNA